MNLPSEQGTTEYHRINVEQTVFRHSFFPSILNDCFNLDINIKNSEFKCRLSLFQFKIAYTIFSTLKD